jgi:hypothetical protein
MNSTSNNNNNNYTNSKTEVIDLTGDEPGPIPETLEGPLEGPLEQPLEGPLEQPLEQPSEGPSEQPLEQPLPECMSRFDVLPPFPYNAFPGKTRNDFLKMSRETINEHVEELTQITNRNTFSDENLDERNLWDLSEIIAVMVILKNGIESKNSNLVQEVTDVLAEYDLFDIGKNCAYYWAENCTVDFFKMLEIILGPINGEPSDVADYLDNLEKAGNYQLLKYVTDKHKSVFCRRENFRINLHRIRNAQRKFAPY